MSDEADNAEVTSELFLRVACRTKHKELQHSGSCHNCDAVLDKGCFCDAECREDWTNRSRLKDRDHA
jgi:hypothetical protein